MYISLLFIFSNIIPSLSQLYYPPTHSTSTHKIANNPGKKIHELHENPGKLYP